MNDIERPKVGLGVLILKDGKVLLGKRKGKFAPGVFACPGGHLEMLESFEEGIRREVTEETGLTIKNVRLVVFSNIIMPPHHYVQVAMIADWESGEPETREPDKCEGWAWYGLDELPEPLFDLSKMIIDAHVRGQRYWDGEWI